jgi:hypothetical protein
LRLPALALTLSFLLAACGGGGSDGTVDDIAEKARRGSRPTASKPATPRPGTSPATPQPAPPTQAATPPAAPAPTPTPTANKLQVLVPAYFYPLPGSAWDRLATTAKAMPDVTVTAIVNPSSGPGNKVDAQYTQAIRSFTGAGGKAIGYVSTRYGAVSQAKARQHIDRYLAFYGREHISGFFLDEMADNASKLAFYRELHDYIKGLDRGLQVVGNPGTLPVGDYAAVADTLVTFEGQASAYARFNPQPEHGWVYEHSTSKQAMLVHDAVDCRAMQSSLGTAATERSHTGWVYVTDLHYDYANNIGDPWAALPAYWDKLLGSVDALNKGQALPSC